MPMGIVAEYDNRLEQYLACGQSKSHKHWLFGQLFRLTTRCLCYLKYGAKAR